MSETCHRCGCLATVTLEDSVIDYGSPGEDAEEISVRQPVFACENCGDQWTNYLGESARDDAIVKFLKERAMNKDSAKEVIKKTSEEHIEQAVNKFKWDRCLHFKDGEISSLKQCGWYIQEEPDFFACRHHSLYWIEVRFTIGDSGERIWGIDTSLGEPLYKVLCEDVEEFDCVCIEDALKLVHEGKIYINNVRATYADVKVFPGDKVCMRHTIFTKVVDYP